MYSSQSLALHFNNLVPPEILLEVISKLVFSGKKLAGGCFECTGVQTLSVPVQGLCCSLFLYSLEASTLLLLVDLVCLKCCFRGVQEEMVRLCLILPLLSLASDCPADSSEGTGEGSCGCSTSRNAGNQNETHQGKQHPPG